MDVNDFRSAVTVLMLLCFGAIVVWALASHRRRAFDEAAQLPLHDEERP
jgi:cytochrome c oxidase cbb3-type subunit IV